VTGDVALQHVGRKETALRDAAGLLKIPPLELPRRLAKLLDEQRQLEKQIESLQGRQAKDQAQDLVAKARPVAGVNVIAVRVEDGLDQERLRALADSVRERLGSGVICLGSTQGDKVSLVTAVSKDLTARFNAGKLIQEVASSVGGRGGGRPDLAQAGGKDPSKLDAALRLVGDWVARQTQ
jgi:alanyl-tRNA synthetase